MWFFDMVNWKHLKTRIPHQVQISRKKYMEIAYVQDFKDGKTLGEMRPDINQIVIKTDMSPKETVCTYIHELLHAISNEYEVNLTENQVLALEKSLYYIFKPGNVIK